MTELVKSKIVAIGGSAGVFAVLKEILPVLSAGFPWPVVVIRHLKANTSDFIVQYFRDLCSLPVEGIEDKTPIQNGTLYFAPANYHVLIEEDFSFVLSIDEKVNFTRPSIDVFFDAVADSYRERVIGILLTGANADGAKGLKKIHKNGGITIVQNPESAEVAFMPKAALHLFDPDYILEPKEIAVRLRELCNEQ